MTCKYQSIMKQQVQPPLLGGTVCLLTAVPPLAISHPFLSSSPLPSRAQSRLGRFTSVLCNPDLPPSALDRPQVSPQHITATPFLGRQQEGHLTENPKTGLTPWFSLTPAETRIFSQLKQGNCFTELP